MFVFNSTAVITFILLTFFILIVRWIRWRRKKLNIFKELRIPGPSPHFLFGNILEINKKGLLECHEEWIQKYGRIVGYYHGLKPVLLITDNDLLKRIFIKDFHLFNRPETVPLRVHSFLDDIIPTMKIMDYILPNANGDEWKRLKTALSPVFSGSRLKMLIPFVDKVSEVTMSIMEKTSLEDRTTDMFYVLRCLIFDVICAQAFALQTNVQRGGEGYSLFRSVNIIFNNSIYSKIYTFGSCFPEMGTLAMAMNFLKMFFANGFSIPVVKLTNFVGEVIEQRRKNPDMRKPDILQSLIDASDIDQNEIKVTDKSDEVTANLNKDLGKSRNKLTDIDIKATSLVICLAGYETTSSSLAFVVYMLAKYPEYQTKIWKEIENILGDKKLDYNNINNLPLLESFITETLRFYPPAITSILRVATEDVDFGSVFIPKGMEISVPVAHIHFNEDNWDNPTKFDPERFLLEKRMANHATNYWTFGMGPRTCIGMKLANITSKVILVKMLQKFSFELPENPEEATLSVSVKFNSIVPDKVLVKIKKRDQLPTE